MIGRGQAMEARATADGCQISHFFHNPLMGSIGRVINYPSSQTTSISYTGLGINTRWSHSFFTPSRDPSSKWGLLDSATNHDVDLGVGWTDSQDRLDGRPVIRVVKLRSPVVEDGSGPRVVTAWRHHVAVCAIYYIPSTRHLDRCNAVKPGLSVNVSVNVKM